MIVMVMVNSFPAILIFTTFSLSYLVSGRSHYLYSGFISPLFHFLSLRLPIGGRKGRKVLRRKFRRRRRNDKKRNGLVMMMMVKGGSSIEREEKKQRDKRSNKKSNN